jgi:hypothetical protein
MNACSLLVSTDGLSRGSADSSTTSPDGSPTAPSDREPDSSTDRPTLRDGAAIAYRGRVGGNSSSGSAMSIPVGGSGVAAGDALVIFLLINNNTSGAVSAKDSAGNTYGMVVDTVDGTEGDRFVALVTVGSHALAAGNRIDLTFPSTSNAVASIEDFAAVGATGPSSGAGSASCTSFSTGPVAASATEMIVGGAAVEAGAASWSTGWTALPPVVGKDGDTVTPAYRIGPTAANSAAATCSGNGWMGAVVSLR